MPGTPLCIKKSGAARPLYGGKKGKNVGRYIVKRILTTIPVLIGVMLVIFIMLSVIPGDPVAVMMKEHVKPELIEKLKGKQGAG